MSVAATEVFSATIEPASVYKPYYGKRLFDIGASIFLIIIFLPLFFILALMVKLTSKGPIIFRQQRYTIYREIFIIYKFRSMLDDGSKRLTPIGYVIRKYKVDELPQLFNVLSGKMSLVGPRPHSLKEASFYEETLPSYAFRYEIKSGLTGLAQIRGGSPHLDKSAISLMTLSDIEYRKNASFLLDIWIVIKTLRFLVP